MGTLYVTQADAFIGKVDERLTVKAEQKRILDIPLINRGNCSTRTGYYFSRRR